MYEQDRGQGWGVIAKRMGIKPGSAEFHALKGNVGKSSGRYKSHPGKGNQAKGGYDDGPGDSGNKGKGYDDGIARARIAQAFGRLIRRADDKGVFVMLDAAAPTRLFAGLPPGVEVQRMTLVEAIELVETFLSPT